MHPLAQLLQRDKRYRPEAYAFVFESLEYAHRVLGLGQDEPSDDDQTLTEEQRAARRGKERHLTGQELCEAIRQYAQDQFGAMAKCVLNSWGVFNTGDFGEIVFSLIRIGQMRKTKQDRREDFENVFDFETNLRRGYEIHVPEPE